MKPKSATILKKWEKSIENAGERDDFINVSSRVIKNLKDVDSDNGANSTVDDSTDVVMLSSDEESAKKPARVYKSKREKKKSKEEPLEDAMDEDEKPKKTRKSKSAEPTEDLKPKKTRKSKTEADVSTDDVKPKRKTKAKSEADESVDDIKPKRKTKAKSEADESTDDVKPKRKTKAKAEADESVDDIKPKIKSRTDSPAEGTPESVKRPRGRPRKIKPEVSPSKSFVNDFSITEDDTTNNSNFEFDNVFQSGGNSSNSTPSIKKKKRHLEEEDEDKKPKPKKKHVDSEVSISSPNTTRERTPRAKKSAESTPLKFSELASEDGASSQKRTPKARSTKSTPKSAKIQTPSKLSTLKDETKSFDEALRKIRNEELGSDSMEVDQEINTLEHPKVALTKQTGIIIEQFDEPKLVPSSPLKPKLRTIPESKKPEILVEDEVESESDDEEEAVAPKSKVKSKVSLFKVFKVFSFLFLWVTLISASLFGYWYREQQYLIGYCGQEVNVSTIPKNSDLPPVVLQLADYLDDNFKPDCVKCPPHARCFKNLELGCYEDFIEYKPWYFDYTPIIDRSLKKCVPDTKKAEKLEIMIDVALDLLRYKNAEKGCGKTAPESAEAGLELSELHDLLLSMKAPYITEEEFEELWSRSIIELEKEPEIIVRQVD